MLKRIYDPKRPYPFFMYGRMSDKNLQNARSPQQQFDTIESVRKRLGYPWQLLEQFRDDGIKGAYITKRAGLQDMLRKIELGISKPSLIAIDTAERLGRNDEVMEIRRVLDSKHGVLVVCADSGFADPSGIMGKSMAVLENFRSTDAGRITGHNVIRGKLDIIRRKIWPGGPAPIGFKLRTETVKRGSKTVAENYLEEEMRDSPAVLMAFQHAAKTGWGSTRMTKWWNFNPLIPDRLKPISRTAMTYMLENEIYIGRLVWGGNVTGVVNDVRVVQPNPDGAHIIEEDFCKRLIDPALFAQVRELQKLRQQKYLDLRGNAKLTKGDAPEFATYGRGLTLTYMLAGLVRCECGAAMRPIPSGAASQDGETYTYYTCPKALAGACENKTSIREEKLRAAVIGILRNLLLPSGDVQFPGNYPELSAMILEELNTLVRQSPDRGAMRAAEISELEGNIKGWGMTLGDPKLPETVRVDIVTKYDDAKTRLQLLQSEGQSDDAIASNIEKLMDPEVVMIELGRLAESLTSSNVTVANLVLSRHIDRIRSTRDGRIELIGTWLGIFGDAAGMVPRNPIVDELENSQIEKPEPVPRRRTRLYVPSLTTARTSLLGQNTILDPERFAGLDEKYLWREPIVLEKSICWAEAHAIEVANKRKEGLTQDQLAEFFHVTPPTIRHAMRIAVKQDPSFAALPRKIPRGRWEEAHYAEVAKLRAEGRSLKELCKHFNKSEPLIRAALVIARNNAAKSDRNS